MELLMTHSLMLQQESTKSKHQKNFLLALTPPFPFEENVSMFMKYKVNESVYTR